MVERGRRGGKEERRKEEKLKEISVGISTSVMSGALVPFFLNGT